MSRIVKKPDIRKKEIIDTARRLFQSLTYEAATMQNVMDEIGIAKGTIYHYFKSKEELLEAVVEDVIDQSLARMEEIVSQSDGNALEKIEQLVLAGDISENNQDLLDHLHQPGNINLHTRLLAVAINKQAPLYAKLIEQGNHEGLFSVSTPLESAEFILTSVQFMTDIGFFPWSQQDLKRRLAAFPSILENLLKAAPGSFGFLSRLG